MNEATRTKRTIQNSRISLALFLVQVFVGFFSRKVFLDYLGTEVLGLNTTLGNILGFMNLAELGIGTAMASSLYKPIHDNNQETILEIISVQGFLYRRVVFFMCVMAVFVLIGLPFIFPNTECGLLYVYVAFIVFFFGSISSYLWNYQQILIYADQKSYKMMKWRHGLRYTILVLQILFFMVFNLGVWSWIGLEFMGSLISVFIVKYVVEKEYPWLHTSEKSSSELLKSYHWLIVKTKQLFVHKIGTYVLEQTAPLIIYGYVSLTMVTYYSNYIIVIGYVSVLLNSIFGGMGASIGSLVSENNKVHTQEVFWELFISRIWLASLACYGMYIFIAPVISLWLGSEFVLPRSTLLLILVGVFIRLSRSVIDSFKEAYQLFADIWAPAVEAAINLGCSIVGGYYWGLNGIIMGSNLSLILIVLIWKPYYVFKCGLQSSYWEYYRQYALLIVIFMLSGSLALLFFPDLSDTPNYFLQILKLVPCYLIFIVITFVVLYVLTKGMKHFTRRILRILTHSV